LLLPLLLFVLSVRRHGIRHRFERRGGGGD
jgi:hypothetical protein